MELCEGLDLGSRREGWSRCPHGQAGARRFGRQWWQNWKSRAAAGGQGEGVGLAPGEGLGALWVSF